MANQACKGCLMFFDSVRPQIYCPMCLEDIRDEYFRYFPETDPERKGVIRRALEKLNIALFSKGEKG